MRAVSGEVVSWKPVELGKTARIIAAFVAMEASSGLPAEAGALVVYATKAAAELHAFHRDAGAGTGERPEEPRKAEEERHQGVV